MGGFRLRATARETFYWAGTTALGSRSDRPPSVGDDNPLSAYISTVQKQFGALSSLSGDDLCDASVSLRSALFNAQLFYRAEESRVSVNTHPCQQTTSLRDSDDILEGVLTFRTLKQLLSENLVRFPTITEDEIDDKSKGDALSKGIALLQLAWFIVQIISRATQGLVISELELTTAALAGLNSVMYVFWWNKPHDVRFPVVIRTKCVDEILTKRSEDAPWTFPDSGSASEFDIRKHLLTTMTTSIKRLLNALVRFFLSLPEALRDASVGIYKSALAFSHGLVILCSRIRQFVRTIGSAICNESAESTGIREEASKVGPKHTFEVHDALELDEKKDVKPEIGDGVKSNKKVCYTLVYNEAKLTYAITFQRPNHTPYGIMGTAKIAMKLIALPFYLLLYTIDLTLYIPIAKIISANDDNALSKDMTSGFDVENANKIYSMIFYSENAGAKPLLATSSIAGALFGLVHCLAWDFSFPSLVEKILWRSASLGVVGSCAAIFYAVLAYQIDDDENDGDDGVKKKGNVVFGILLVVATALCSLASFVYPVSRVAIIILAVASLRSLPPSAFDTVDWIELVPHI